MIDTFTVRIAACPDYEKLLEECHSTLVAWKTKREEVEQFGPRGKSAGDVLQRLQAEYARAYNRLERHAKNCRTCHFQKEQENSNRPEATETETRKELIA